MVLRKPESNQSRTYYYANATKLGQTPILCFTNGGTSLARMVSVPPNSFLAAASVHHCLYSPFRIDLSIFTMLQFPKTNLTLSPRHSMISIKWRCRYYNPARLFMYKIRRLLSGAPSAPFFQSGRTSYLMMSLLLTVLFFGPDVFSAQHLLSIHLLLLLHLLLHRIIFLLLL